MAPGIPGDQEAAVNLRISSIKAVPGAAIAAHTASLNNDSTQRAPLREMTTATVLKRIIRSSHSDQLRM